MNIHTHHVGEGINILDVGEGKAWVEKEKRRELVEGQNVFYSVGVHPMKLNELGESVFVGIEDTVRIKKVIAIGECGLDRRSPICMKTQEEILEVQVRLAEELCKPLIIHCVKAYSELIAVRKRTINHPCLGLFMGIIITNGYCDSCWIASSIFPWVRHCRIHVRMLFSYYG